MKSLEDFFFYLITISYVSFCVEPLTSRPLKSHSAFRSTSKALYGELHVHCTVLFCKTTINQSQLHKQFVFTFRVLRFFFTNHAVLCLSEKFFPFLKWLTSSCKCIARRASIQLRNIQNKKSNQRRNIPFSLLPQKQHSRCSLVIH